MKDRLKPLIKQFDNSSEYVEQKLHECDHIHNEFLRKWPEEKLAELLTLDSYVIGKGDSNNFCYWLERKTRILGSILGATAKKFKVYYNYNEDCYEWVAGFSNEQQAFQKTKSEIINLVKSAKKNDIDAIKKNTFFKHSHLVRGKLLYLYFPQKFLNIFAEDDIDYFLDKLGVEFNPDEHVIDKQSKLLSFKDECNLTKGWTTRKFGYFLYDQFHPPSRSHSMKQNDTNTAEKEILSEEGDFILPKVEESELVELDFNDLVFSSASNKKGTKSKRRPNYIAESIRNTKLGSHAENVVVGFEKKKLKQLRKTKLANKVKRVSLDDDSLGYDILSFAPNGVEKYIEVKATKASMERNTPFYLTENERNTMNKKKNRYFLYRVFSANTNNPQLLVLTHQQLRKRCNIKTKLWQISFK